jgi:hypothetical protein
MAESLKTLCKGEFERKLAIYCDSVERRIPQNYAKTPAKYNQEHFNWLVDYQVAPTKEYKEIAQEIDVKDRPTIDAIKKSIRRLSKLIEISLRKSKSLGRPKGIKETKTRRRETKNTK